MSRTLIVGGIIGVIMVFLSMVSIATAQTVSSPISQHVSQTSSLPISLIEALRPPAGLDLCGEPVEFDTPDTIERYQKEMLLILWDQPQVILWLKRSTRFFPYMVQQLQQRGMPEDIRFLPIVESALRPDAGSSKGAVGLWQLMPATARKYGLRVDAQIDERRDLMLATRAALDYLQDLQAQFNSWTMAMAAYNMGEDGLGAEVLEQETADYYKLYLPLETQRYIFRILVTKIVIGSPSTYGIDLDREEYYPPERFDLLSLNCTEETPLRLVAAAANTYFKIIKDLNPKFRSRSVPIGEHQICLPPGNGVGFQERLEKKIHEYQQLRQNSIYVVQSGDSLTSIAKKFNVPLNAIKIWNQLDLNKPIQPGNQLVIYPRKHAATVP